MDPQELGALETKLERLVVEHYSKYKEENKKLKEDYNKLKKENERHEKVMEIIDGAINSPLPRAHPEAPPHQ